MLIKLCKPPLKLKHTDAELRDYYDEKSSKGRRSKTKVYTLTNILNQKINFECTTNEANSGFFAVFQEIDNRPKSVFSYITLIDNNLSKMTIQNKIKNVKILKKPETLKERKNNNTLNLFE